MSDSRKSKPKKRSRLTHSDDDDSSNSDSSDARYNSHKRESHRRHAKSVSSEKVNKNVSSPQIKSLVKVPLPSLLTPTSLVLSGNKISVKAKVVQNKSGSERKSQVAKSLMDLQFEDRSLSRTSYHNDERSSRKPGLLPEPYEMIHQDHVNIRRKPIPPDSRSIRKESDEWSSAKEMRTLRRSWTESEAGASHSLFNSKYKPLVVESEPLIKVRKIEKSPKPLLESQILPSLSLSTPRSLPSPGLSHGLSHDDGYEGHANMADGGGQVHKRRPAKIVEIKSKKSASYLVIPSTCPWVHLHGHVKIKVIRGVVTILAHTLTPGTYYEVYSPSSNCLLSLQVDKTDLMSPDDVKTELEKLGENTSELQWLSDRSIGIVKVEKLNSVVCDYVTTIPPFTKVLTPKPALDTKRSAGVTLFGGELKIAPESEMGVPCMTWDDQYNVALDKWLETIDKGGQGDQSPVFVTCGAKNAGKSMFNRCAVNMTLRSVPEVAYLDCDVGQSEFSPPATLSLHIISKPVLSSPFCHQRHAEKMVFYGDISPAQDPSFYVECLHHVFQAYKKLAHGKKLPLIINTMGFPEGVGFMLFIDTMNIARPDLVVQFESDQLFANFPPVTQEMIALDEGWTFNKCPPPDVKERVSQVKEPKLLILSSLNRNERIVISHKLHPADLRNLTMFSALSLGLGEDETLTSLTPYTVPYHKLAIHVCRYTLPVDEILTAIDGGVVALCEADLTQAKKDSEDSFLTFDDMPVCDCLGLGIVRAVDGEKGLLYISTTLPRHLLKRVNTVLKGTLSLPDHFIMKQQSTSAYPVPYVDSVAQATAAFGLRTRSRMPRIHSHAKKVV